VAAALRDRETLHELTDGTEPVGREGTVTGLAVPEFRTSGLRFRTRVRANRRRKR
jgi:hypothetical protein